MSLPPVYFIQEHIWRALYIYITWPIWHWYQCKVYEDAWLATTVYRLGNSHLWFWGSVLWTHQEEAAGFRAYVSLRFSLKLPPAGLWLFHFCSVLFFFFLMCFTSLQVPLRNFDIKRLKGKVGNSNGFLLMLDAYIVSQALSCQIVFSWNAPAFWSIAAAWCWTNHPEHRWKNSFGFSRPICKSSADWYVIIFRLR